MNIVREANDAEHPEGMTIKTRGSGVMIVISCTGNTTEIALAELEDGSRVPCPCGQEFTLTLNGIAELKRGLQSLQDSVDQANRTLAGLGIAGMKITID